MISICIPIFNRDCTVLVGALHEQALSLAIPFEIICIDDASEEIYNAKNDNLSSLSSVQYIPLEKNIGRSAIRNLLAEKASYPYLLFLDCDVQIPTSHYLSHYIDNIHKGLLVIVGGRIYENNKPASSHLLHYEYGRKRESNTANVRAIKPYDAFVTGNFIIEKSIFSEIKFNEILTEYGHEDTLFGIELKKKNIPIHHINNPVLHAGLEKNAVFIQKQLLAIDNLAKLIHNGQDMSSLKLYRYYKILKDWKLLFVFKHTFGLFEKVIKSALENGWTNKLFLFDLLKLYTLSKQLKSSN